jgi:phage tail sheath protein FI
MPPPDPTYPGVYVEETRGGPRTISGVPTSITAFVGRTLQGPTNAPTLVTSYTDFERTYGGPSLASPLSYAVQHFFGNGGTQALIARIVHIDASGAADESVEITDADISAASCEAEHRGLWLLDQVDTFNLLCIPPLSRTADVDRSTWDAAIRYAAKRRAFVIVDPPSTWATPADVLKGLPSVVTRDRDAAIYFPRITAADPLTGRQDEAFAPCGAVAGLFARSDRDRGVWKAPAGIEATLTGTTGLTVNLNDADTSELNPAAVNCLRSFPGRGNVVWGARTLEGADSLASEWKYVPVRRLALFIEESVYRGTQWAVFEPNTETLWSQLRNSIGDLLNGLFRQGAFQGISPREAYFVKCNADTTTQSDIAAGRVNVEVGFAPTRRAEFVVLQFEIQSADMHT